jgi:FkbM family methyltransferase
MTSNSDVIFDVGLHRGEDSAAYLAQGYRVVAFEADPVLADACRVRFSDAIAAGALAIVEGAIAPGDAATIRFYRNPGHSYWGTVDPDWAERNARLGQESQIIELPRTDFAAALLRYGTPLYMKIDIEGADRHVLETLGAVGVSPPYVSIETARDRFADVEDELRLLDRLGYRSFNIVQQAGLCEVPVRLTARTGELVTHVFEPGGSGPWGPDLAGPWVPLPKALAAYRRIFAGYRLFGEEGLASRLFGRAAISWAAWRLGVAAGGWHDVHARLAPPD